jgi:hypothetical protein
MAEKWGWQARNQSFQGTSRASMAFGRMMVTLYIKEDGKKRPVPLF